MMRYQEIRVCTVVVQRQIQETVNKNLKEKTVMLYIYNNYTKKKKE